MRDMGKRRLDGYKVKKEPSRLVRILSARPLLTVGVFLLAVELVAFVVVLRWFDIKAAVECFRLRSVSTKSAMEAYEELMRMGTLAVPVLLDKALDEKDDKYFLIEATLLDHAGRLDLLPPDYRVKYYLMSLSRDEWGRSVAAMKRIVEIGLAAVPYLVRVLATGFRLHKYCTLCVLSRIEGWKKGYETVLRQIYDPEPLISGKAVWTLDASGNYRHCRGKLVEFLAGPRFRGFNETMKLYACDFLSRLAEPALDERMRKLFEEGRPFEQRLAAGYFALSKDMGEVRRVVEASLREEFSEDVRYQVLTCLKLRLKDAAVQKLMLEFLSDARRGIARYMANQYLIVASLSPAMLDAVRKLAESASDPGVRWDAAVVMCYHGLKESYPILEEALVEGAKSARYARVSKQAAVALGESGDPDALALLVKLSLAGSKLQRIRAIYWGLRIYGRCEGDWKLPPETKSVYGVLKKIGDDPAEVPEVRGFAKKALSEIATRPGQETGPVVPKIDMDEWGFPVFLDRGRHINEIIRERMGYYDYPQPRR